MKLKRLGCSALLMVGSLTSPLAAQQPAATTAAPAPASAVAIDATKLPINLVKLQQKLQMAAERESSGTGPRIRYAIDVIGTAPRNPVFPPGTDLRYGPVPWSAPTHQDMLDFVTPKEFRSPVMDFGNLMRWIQSKTKRTD
jgi:hypothetical protein